MSLPISPIPVAPARAPLSYQQIDWLEAEHRGMVGCVGRNGLQASNIYAALRIHGRLNIELVERSALELVRRHQVLRTTFMRQEGQVIPVMTVRGTVPIDVADLRSGDPASRAERAQNLAAEMAAKPFDYQRDLMFRLLVARLAHDDYLLMVTTPHLVSDGRSLHVCVRELVDLYSGFARRAPARFPEFERQYVDFAAWQHRWLAEEVFDAVERHYRERLIDAPPLMLPTDRPRSRRQLFTAAEHSFTIASNAGATDLRQVAWRLRVAPIVVILAAYTTLLACWSHQDDVLLFMPLAGRIQPGLVHAVGFFASFAQLRVSVSDRPSFYHIVARLRASLNEAKAMEGVPYRFLAEVARRQHREAPWPFVSANVVKSVYEDDVFALPGAYAERVPLELPAEFATPLSRYDLNLLIAFQRSGAVSGMLRYRTELFDASTIAAFGRCLLSILHAATLADELRFGQLAALAHDARSSNSSVRE